MAREHVLTSVVLPFVQVFIVQSAGWIAFLVQCFYWTSYVPEVSFKAQPNTPEFNEGVRWGTLTMAAESLAAFFLGYLLPLVNHKLGTRRVFYFTQIVRGARSVPVALLVTPATHVSLILTARTVLHACDRCDAVPRGANKVGFHGCLPPRQCVPCS